jgi:hypothetical protein
LTDTNVYVSEAEEAASEDVVYVDVMQNKAQKNGKGINTHKV